MHKIYNFKFISSIKLIYSNVDCKICKAAFFKSPAKSKNFKAYSFSYFYFYFKMLNENMFNNKKKANLFSHLNLYFNKK